MRSLPCELPGTWLQRADFSSFTLQFLLLQHCIIHVDVYSLFCILLTTAGMAKDFVIEKANRPGSEDLRKLILMHVHFLSLFPKLQKSPEGP